MAKRFENFGRRCKRSNDPKMRASHNEQRVNVLTVKAVTEKMRPRRQRPAGVFDTICGTKSKLFGALLSSQNLNLEYLRV